MENYEPIKDNVFEEYLMIWYGERKKTRYRISISTDRLEKILTDTEILTMAFLWMEVMDNILFSLLKKKETDLFAASEKLNEH